MALAPLVVLLTGQSLNLSDAEGGTGPFPVGKQWDLQWLASTSFTSFGAASRTKDVAIALGLEAAGREVILINIALGGTSAKEWLPPSGTAWVSAEASLRAAMLLLPAALGGRYAEWIHLHDQGEKDVANAAGAAAAASWAADTLAMFAELERITGRKMRHILGLTKNPQPSNFWINEIRAGQLTVAGSTAYLINRDDLTYKVDNIHLQHPDNERLYGARQVAKILEVLPMSTILPAAANALIDHARNKTAYSPAANHYAHAKIAGNYVTGNGYAPVALANNKTTYGVSSAGALSNLVGWTFPTPTGNWGAIDEIEISDSATPGAGLIIFRHTQSPAVTIGTTNGAGGTATGPLTIPAGALTITLTGGFGVTVKNELLNLMFGGTANAARATVFGTYYVGKPSTGGTETSVSRLSVTQATAWGAASAGAALNVAALALADKADATWYAEYTASSAGTLLFEALLQATPTAGQIPAGGLRTRLT